MAPTRVLVGVRFEQRAQLLGGQHLGQTPLVARGLHAESRVDFDLAVARQPTEVARECSLLAGDAAASHAARGEKSDIRTNV
ncbi:MAG: hypothetical protein EBY84_07420 [Acidimicrobiia bacterium]|nr:hypothetical protein [Acidimicrobiia bacterium]